MRCGSVLADAWTIAWVLSVIAATCWITQESLECSSHECSPLSPTRLDDSAVVWDEHYEPFLFTSFCNIPRLDARQLTRDEFEQQFLDKRPVILSHAVNNSRFRRLVQKGPLLKAYGDSFITLSSANRNSYAKKEERLRKYVEAYIHRPQQINVSGADSWYHFGDNKHDEWSDVFRQYIRPSTFTFGPYSSLSFGIGSSGSGVPFHTHGHVFAEVFYGKKRWWLQEPHPHLEPRFNGDESSLAWLLNVYPTLTEDERPRLHECVCDVGDMLYIPGLWHHATLNLGQTVFMSIFV